MERNVRAQEVRTLNRSYTTARSRSSARICIVLRLALATAAANVKLLLDLVHSCDCC